MLHNDKKTCANNVQVDWRARYGACSRPDSYSTTSSSARARADGIAAGMCGLIGGVNLVVFDLENKDAQSRVKEKMESASVYSPITGAKGEPWQGQ